MSAAHLVIARAGASTVAELAAMGRPAILVPLPGAIDDHQSANARFLAAAGAAWAMDQREFTPEALTQRLAQVLNDAGQLARAAAACAEAGRADAARDLADTVAEVIEVRANALALSGAVA